MRTDPGHCEALARAHDMRAMHAEGLPVGLIAAFFRYQPHHVESIVSWHQRLYPVMPEYTGDCAAWREFAGRYLRGRL